MISEFELDTREKMMPVGDSERQLIAEIRRLRGALLNISETLDDLECRCLAKQALGLTDDA